MLTSRLVSPLIAVLHTFISSNWRVVSFPLSPKSHGSTCFRPDLPGSSFQTPAILSVGGGGPSCRDPKRHVERNRLPALEGCSQQQRLEKEGRHSLIGDDSELCESPSRARVAAFQKDGYRWRSKVQRRSCLSPGVADAVGNTQCRSMATFPKAG